MEDQIITLKTYESTIEAMVDQDILRANNIECFINNEQLIELYPMFKDIDEGLKIVVFEKDYERATKLLADVVEASQAENNIQNQHADSNVYDYLYSFSDSDLIDVIANPSDWTNKELLIANQIVKTRNLLITAQDIRHARAKRNDKANGSLSGKNKINQWFLIIGYLSIINTIILIARLSIHFVFGLGITQLIETRYISMYGNYKYLAVLISLMISGVFLALGYAKGNKKGIYITGLILYGLDTCIFIYTTDWLSVAFHIFVLVAIIRGYLNLYSSKRV